MFGYVTICKECLSEEGINTFRAYYCGLCRETGRQCSQVARLGLSYDITFLAIMLSSLLPDGETDTHRCLVKGGRKVPCRKNDAAVSYAADMGVLLSYLKLYDDWKDEKSIKALAQMRLFRKAVKKARSRYPKTYDDIKGQLDTLSALERAKCALTDEAADPFAKILEILFTPDCISDKGQKRALAWLGYNLGRWIYIIDAYNDIEKDIKSGSYNTFIIANKSQTAEEIKRTVRKEADEALTFTLSNIASAYDLLDIKRNGEVIRNIIFTALLRKQKNILGENNESL